MPTYIVSRTTQITEQFEIDADDPNAARDAFKSDSTKAKSRGSSTENVRIDVRGQAASAQSATSGPARAAARRS